MKSVVLLPLLVLLLCVNGLSAATVPGPGAVAAKLEKVISESGLPKSDLGIYVGNGKSEPVFELNGDKHFIPASITKLITAAAVMNAFTPYYKFHTKLLVDGVRKGNMLDGNIYLKGGGDPAFVSEKMWMLVDDFTRTGIKKITGAIIVDDSYFDDERIDPGREPDRNDRAYDAPISGLSFNWNSTTIYVRPGSRAGEKALAWVDPKNDYVTLKNEVVTSPRGTDLVASKAPGRNGDVVTIKGKIASKSDEQHSYKNISEPALYAGANLKEFLKQRGIEVEGRVKRGVTPDGARLAADCEGEPLRRIVLDMDKFSNNFVAETLAKDLGAYRTGGQGHMADGLNAIRSFLKTELGFKPDDFSLVNVSGFTRKNSFSPRQFVQVLAWVQHHFRIYPEFLQSLPVAGVDGTLKKRMKEDGVAGWVRAKTGLLNGVVALAGYAGRHDDGVMTFTFIYNGHGNEAHVRAVFDAMAAALVERAGSE